MINSGLAHIFHSAFITPKTKFWCGLAVDEAGNLYLLIDWLIDLMIDWLQNKVVMRHVNAVDWLIDWLVYWWKVQSGDEAENFIDWFTDWLVYWWKVQSVDEAASYTLLIHWLMFDCLIALLIDCLKVKVVMKQKTLLFIDSLIVWLINWLTIGLQIQSGECALG